MRCKLKKLGELGLATHELRSGWRALTDAYTLPADGTVVLTPTEGYYTDPSAKIWPFRRHDGTQPYDTARNTLVAPYTAGPNGSGA